jgi:hypothetical protein
MTSDPHVTQRWTRWHSDDWTLVVTRTGQGEFFYTITHEGVERPPAPAASKVEAQHQAEDIVRRSGHRCVARCSFWVPDTPEELD